MGNPPSYLDQYVAEHDAQMDGPLSKEAALKSWATTNGFLETAGSGASFKNRFIETVGSRAISKIRCRIVKLEDIPRVAARNAKSF
jgi:hypothetical protein